MNIHNVAIIPVRGGSKSIPLKNIKMICGKPLVYWTAKAASECKYIDAVYVSTDSPLIKKTVENFCLNKVQVIGRSDETATDTASTESVMLEFASKYEFDNIVLIQATSPMLTSEDLNNAFEIFNEQETDSVLSAVRHKRFHWEITDDGYAKALNYNVFHRPRRQEFEGDWVENGAFYITSKTGLLTSQNRVFGNIRIAEMPEETYYEIDELSDWAIIEKIMESRYAKNNIKEIPQIKLFLTDCDGCLTDGGMYYSEMGDELKKFNTYDGMGFSLLKEHGILTGIVTGENVVLNKRRAQKLKIDYYISDCKDKVSAVTKICENNNLELEDVAYFGDDINDLKLIKSVGIGFAPANAIQEIKDAADIVTILKGGEGAVREAIEIILKRIES